MLLMVTSRRVRGGTYVDEEQPNHGKHYLIDYAGAPRGKDGFGRKVNRVSFGKVIQAELQRQVADPVIETPTVGIYIHGYNNDWQDSIDELVDLHRCLNDHLGYEPFLIGFSWPSSGKLRNYLADREEARQSVPAFTRFICDIAAFVRNNQQDCVARSYCIAHSMGGYLLRKGMEYASDYLGNPVGLKLFDETILLSADLSTKDLESNGKGRYVRHLSRRVHIYYSKHDTVLRASSAKRFGRRRLGRHGAKPEALPDNVVLVDMEKYANEDAVHEAGLTTRRGEKVSVHSAARYHPEIIRDFWQVVLSLDRGLIHTRMAVDADEDRHYKLT